MTIGLTYNGDLSRVQIAISGLPDGTYRIERSTNELLWETVRGGVALPVSGGTGALDDFEFAADVSNFYRAVPIGLENLMEVFTSGGTWNKPVGLVAVRVRVVGGGGAGGGAATTAAGEGSAGSGGNGGGYAEDMIDAVSLGASETVTVGAGGTGIAGSDGNPGASSSFGAHVVATGGGGGKLGPAEAFDGNPVDPGATVGIGTTGAILTAGQQGSLGIRITVNRTKGGTGGSSVMGGGAGNSSANSNGAASTGYGGGGGGGNNNTSQVTARAGGAGAPGVVIVENIFWPPEV